MAIIEWQFLELKPMEYLADAQSRHHLYPLAVGFFLHQSSGLLLILRSSNKINLLLCLTIH